MVTGSMPVANAVAVTIPWMSDAVIACLASVVAFATVDQALLLPEVSTARTANQRRVA